MMLKHKGTVGLTTERLTLRRFTLADAQKMFENWHSDPEVTKYLSWYPDKSVDGTLELLTEWTSKYGSEEYYNWAIEYDGELVGNIEMVVVSNRCECLEFGYCLSRKFWGLGIMTEAVERVRDFLFDEVGANRLVIGHVRENTASGRVAQKCGFRWEGTERKRFLDKAGVFHDIERYSLMRDEQPHYVRRELTLDTPRLILRPIRTLDLDDVYAYTGNSANTYYMYFHRETREQTLDFLKRCEHEWSRDIILNYEFAVVLRDSGKLIGSCGIYLNDERTMAELGWILHRDYWKMGYTPEAGYAMLKYCFDTLGVHRVCATCDADNYGSRRVMEKLGMKREAELRKVRPLHGERSGYANEYVYGILIEEWTAAKTEEQ